MHPNSVVFSKIYSNFDIYFGIFCFSMKFSTLAPNLEGTEIAEDAPSCLHVP